MKLFTRSILSLAAVSFIFADAGAAEQFITGGLKYEALSDSTVTVLKYQEGTEIDLPTKVTDPETKKEYQVVQVSGQAFLNAPITSLKVPASVKTIEQYAFWRTQIETLDLAEGVETIGYGAFKECKKLKTVKIPNSVKDLGAIYSLFGIGGAAFAECDALTDVELPASLDSIHQQTFINCLSLKNVSISEGIKSIGERAFEGCNVLHSIKLPSTLERMDRGVFIKSGLTNPTIPGSIKIIPNSCYLWCQNMTGFTIEEGIVEVGRQSFADCRGFTEIETPNSVEWIRTDAFSGNANVKTIKLGSGIRRLGHSSLAVWEPTEKNIPVWSLTDIYIDSPVPPVHEQNDEHFDILEDDFFFGDKKAFTDEYTHKFYSTVKLHVPEDAVDAYRKAEVWKNFSYINDTYNAVDAIEAESGLSVCGGMVTSNGMIEIYTLTGMKVASANGSFDLRGLGSGVYVVRSAGKTIKTAI